MNAQCLNELLILLYRLEKHAEGGQPNIKYLVETRQNLQIPYHQIVAVVFNHPYSPCVIEKFRIFATLLESVSFKLEHYIHLAIGLTFLAEDVGKAINALLDLQDALISDTAIQSQKTRLINKKAPFKSSDFHQEQTSHVDSLPDEILKLILIERIMGCASWLELMHCIMKTRNVNKKFRSLLEDRIVSDNINQKMQQLGSQNEFSNKLKVAAIFKVMSLYNSTYLQIFITPSDIKSCTLDEILRILIKHRASKEVFDSLFNLNIKIRDIKGAWDLINQPDFPLKETLTTDPKWTAEILASMFTNYSYRVDLNLTAEALKIAVKSQNPRLVLFFAKPLNLGLHKRYIQLFNEAMKSNTKSEIDMIKNIINRNYAFKKQLSSIIQLGETSTLYKMPDNVISILESLCTYLRKNPCLDPKILYQKWKRELSQSEQIDPLAVLGNYDSKPVNHFKIKCLPLLTEYANFSSKPIINNSNDNNSGPPMPQ